MEKHTIKREDGRYLIYYTFRTTAGGDSQKHLPAPERAEKEVMQDHVGTEVEPAARRVGRDRNS